MRALSLGLGTYLAVAAAISYQLKNDTQSVDSDSHEAYIAPKVESAQSVGSDSHEAYIAPKVESAQSSKARKPHDIFPQRIPEQQIINYLNISDFKKLKHTTRTELTPPCFSDCYCGVALSDSLIEKGSLLISAEHLPLQSDPLTISVGLNKYNTAICAGMIGNE